MATIANAKATLRIMGDNLTPEGVTKVLGSSPTEAQYKGQVLVGKNTGKSRVAKSGMWQLRAAETTPGDLDAQVREIIDQLTDDFTVWDNLAARFVIDLYCGWFMEKENEGMGISADTLRELAARSIHLSLDIYSSDRDEVTSQERKVS
jgi:Domain of unknown function (DUF4279)